MRKVVELDIDRKVGFPIRAELGRRTGRVTVPSVWIGEKPKKRLFTNNIRRRDY